jgi:hypothetical protein
MLTFMPTRPVGFTASSSAFRRRVPHIGYPYIGKATRNTIRVEAALEASQPGVGTATFLAELAASAPCRVHPIPIHPPR